MLMIMMAMVAIRGFGETSSAGRLKSALKALRIFLCLCNQTSCSILGLPLSGSESCSVYQASEVYAEPALGSN